jgi:hypothetical protein
VLPTKLRGIEVLADSTLWTCRTGRSLGWGTRGATQLATRLHVRVIEQHHRFTVTALTSNSLPTDLATTHQSRSAWRMSAVPSSTALVVTKARLDSGSSAKGPVIASSMASVVRVSTS